MLVSSHRPLIYLRASLANVVDEQYDSHPSERMTHMQHTFWSTYDGSSPLDHAEADRTPEQLAALWLDPSARVLRLTSAGETDGTQHALRPTALFDDELPFAEVQPLGVVYLGRVAEQPWFAIRDDAVSAKTARQLQSIRAADLDDVSRHLLVSAHAVLNWQEATRFCSRCGGELRPFKGGFAALCGACGCQHFPRTDPAIIVAVLNQRDELFLAHQSTWSAGRVSLLAGFVEAGESLTAACHREIAEEAALQLGSVRFLSSQPWPFPRSLMVGFVARAIGGVAGADEAGRVDGVELDHGAFYRREEVDAQVASGELTLPGPGSIANRIIAAWLAGHLPDPEG